MQIGSYPIRPIAYPTSEGHTAKTEAVLPARQNGKSEATQTLRAVLDAQEADKLILRSRSRTFRADKDLMQADPSARKALSAYRSLDQAAERDYVSTVLGIDLYA
jgi:hypothetical protein